MEHDKHAQEPIDYVDLMEEVLCIPGKTASPKLITEADNYLLLSISAGKSIGKIFFN